MRKNGIWPRWPSRLLDLKTNEEYAVRSKPVLRIYWDSPVRCVCRAAYLIEISLEVLVAIRFPTSCACLFWWGRIQLLQNPLRFVLVRPYLTCMCRSRPFRSLPYTAFNWNHNILRNEQQFFWSWRRKCYESVTGADLVRHRIISATTESWKPCFFFVGAEENRRARAHPIIVR